ncbi:MAG: ABC transporter permease [Candidatus Paceibacteria bacterium]
MIGYYVWTLFIRRPIRIIFVVFGMIIAILLVAVIVLGLQNAKRVLVNDLLKEQIAVNRILISNTAVPVSSFAGLDEALSSIGIQKSEESKTRTQITPELVQRMRERENIREVEGVIDLSSQFTYTIADTEVSRPSVVGRSLSEQSRQFRETWGNVNSYTANEVIISRGLIEEIETLQSPSEAIGTSVQIRYQRSSKKQRTQDLSGRAELLPGSVDEKLTIVGVYQSEVLSYDMILSGEKAARIMQQAGEYSTVADYYEENPYDIAFVFAKRGHIEEVKRWLNTSYSFKAIVTQKEQLQFLDQFIRILEIALLSFGIVSAIVAGVSVTSIIMMNVYEQQLSIGIMKASGASSIQIGSIFILYSICLGLLASGIALGVLWGLVALADPIIVDLLDQQNISVEQFFRISPTFIGTVVGITTLVSMLAGLYPSLKASFIDPKRMLTYD